MSGPRSLVRTFKLERLRGVRTDRSVLPRDLLIGTDCTDLVLRYTLPCSPGECTASICDRFL